MLRLPDLAEEERFVAQLRVSNVRVADREEQLLRDLEGVR